MAVSEKFLKFSKDGNPLVSVKKSEKHKANAVMLDFFDEHGTPLRRYDKQFSKTYMSKDKKTIIYRY